MVKTLIGKKIGMTQVFDEEGTLLPVTVLRVGPCPIVQIKKKADELPPDIQIGFDEKKRKNTSNALLGHFDKAGVSPKKVLRDVEAEADIELELGQALTVEIFGDTKLVDVVGTSKGRGFAGVVRRHGFSGGRGSHGGKAVRHAGSIGPGTDPGRVIKGRRMAGQMGNERVTMRNLEVVKIDPEQNLLLVKGSVPGSKGNYVMVSKVSETEV